MLKRKIFGTLAIAIFSICFVSSLVGQLIPPGPADTGLGGANSIFGMVLVSSGQRLERSVPVRLKSMTLGDRVVMTDDYGKFAFRGLVSGDYTIVIDKEKDFEPYSQIVSVTQIRGFPPQTYNVSVRLNPKRSADVRPSVLRTEFANVPQKALAYYDAAIELAKAGNRREAIESLRRAILEYPAFTSAFSEIGVQYLHLNEFEKADEALRAALKIDPDGYAPLVNRGIVLFTMKRYAEAETSLEKAVRMKDQEPVGHYFLGQTLAYLGRFDDAEKELVSAVSLGGDEMKEAHRLLAIIYSSKGDKKRVAEALETYLKLAPKTPDAEQLRKVIVQLKETASSPTTLPSTKPNR